MTQAPLVECLVTTVAALPGVVAISLGGSTSTGLADAESDHDLHVYWQPPLLDAQARATRLAQIADTGSLHVDVHSWGQEDHLRIAGQVIELIYVHFDDLHAQVAQAYETGLSDEGYTTAQLHNVANGRSLYDPSGALAELQARLRTTFPEATRRHLLRYHPALLRVYLAHVVKAQRRGDWLYVQHRRYTLHMVFFNLLFTLNRLYHPGEKRLLTHLQQCALQPADCAARWILTTRLFADDPALPAALEALVDDLIALIEQYGNVEIAEYPY